MIASALRAVDLSSAGTASEGSRNPYPAYVGMSRVNRVTYTGVDGASAVGPQPINASCDTKEKKKGLVCVVPDTASGPCRWEGGRFLREV